MEYSLVSSVLHTIGYGLILISLLFAAVDTIERKKEKGWPFYLNLQVGILCAIAGFVLLLIGTWI